jgi:CRP-like cAMP-binding protein
MNQLHPVPEEELNAFLNQFVMIDLKKGEVLLREGEVCKHLYFILKGGIRCFMHDESGKEINLHFYFEDELASEFKSLRFQIPSDRNLVTLSSSKVLRAARPDYEEMFANNIDFTQAAFRFFQDMFLKEEEHSEMLRKLSADERYQYVLENHPHLLQKISLTQLASWLGISRESLSRIRARFSN